MRSRLYTADAAGRFLVSGAHGLCLVPALPERGAANKIPVAKPGAYPVRVRSTRSDIDWLIGAPHAFWCADPFAELECTGSESGDTWKALLLDPGDQLSPGGLVRATSPQAVMSNELVYGAAPTGGTGGVALGSSLRGCVAWTAQLLCTVDTQVQLWFGQTRNVTASGGVAEGAWWCKGEVVDVPVLGSYETITISREVIDARQRLYFQNLGGGILYITLDRVYLVG